MMIDIMANKGIQQPRFIVDNTALYKPLLPDRSYTGLLQNAYNATMFTKIDHFTVLSIGLSLPLGFTITNNPNDEPLITELYTREVITGNLALIDKYYLPFDSYEISIGKFYELGNNYNHNFELLFLLPTIDGILANISMLNVPAALNTIQFPAFLFAKIQHTLVLTQIP